MSELVLITAASSVSGTMPLYLNQLAAANIEVHVEPLTPEIMPNLGGGGNLGGKVAIMRRLTQQFSHYEKIVFSDAWDVQFFGAKEEVLAKIPDDYVLCAAERNCYPEPHLAAAISGDMPWRFFNGGLSAGTPVSFLRWLDCLEREPDYDPTMLDQAFFNRKLAAGSSLVNLDSTTTLFYCTFGEEGAIADLQFDAHGLPVNILCNTRPHWIHSNGKWPSDHIYARRKPL